MCKQSKPIANLIDTISYLKNVRYLGSSDEGLNPKVERLNGNMRDRETIMRGLDNADAAQQLVDAMRIHYNFIRSNQAVGGSNSR